MPEGTADELRTSLRQRLSDLRSSLPGKYADIETQTVKAVRSGGTATNLILEEGNRDSRYSLATMGLLKGEAVLFLHQAVRRLLQVEPSMHHEGAFIHLSIGDLIFNPEGRRATTAGPRVDAEIVRKYYSSIRENITPGEPISLELVRVMPTLGHHDSVDVIAAFLPVNNRALTIKDEINRAIRQAQSEGYTPMRPFNILHATLGRLPQQPTKDGDRIPLLDAIDEVNSMIPSKKTVFVDEIDITSARTAGFIWEHDRVFVSPPISLVKPNSKEDQGKFMKPSVRIPSDTK